MTQTLPVDPQNPMMMDPTVLPSSWTLATAQSPIGTLAFVCLRTPDVTLTVKLTREDVERLAADLLATAKSMSGLIVPGPLRG